MKYLVGIDLGGTDIKSAILTEEGEIIARSKIETKVERGAADAMHRVAQDIERLLKGNHIKKQEVRGVGIGSPGPLSTRLGIIHRAPNLIGWDNAPLRKLLSEALSLPVMLYNDANAAAYGEFWQGAGKDISTLVLFTIGTGVGGGLILNNKLYVGIDETAGELGHITILPDSNAPLCSCGNRGCLEALASATAIVRRVKKGVDRGVATILKEDAEKGMLTSKSVYIAAKNEDKFALQILEETGRYLGIAAAFMIDALNPEVIVFGGGVSAAVGSGVGAPDDFLFKWIIDEAKKRSLEVPFKRVKIVPASLGNDAGFIGAAGLLLSDLENCPK